MYAHIVLGVLASDAYLTNDKHEPEMLRGLPFCLIHNLASFDYYCYDAIAAVHI